MALTTTEINEASLLVTLIKDYRDKTTSEKTFKDMNSWDVTMSVVTAIHHDFMSVNGITLEGLESLRSMRESFMIPLPRPVSRPADICDTTDSPESNAEAIDSAQGENLPWNVPSPAASVSEPSKATVVKIDGGGASYCSACDGQLDFSWYAIYSDGADLPFCSTCCPSVGDAY